MKLAGMKCKPKKPNTREKQKANAKEGERKKNYMAKAGNGSEYEFVIYSFSF